MSAAITVTIRAHPLNSWLLRVVARPVVMVDDVVHVTRWSLAERIPLTPGSHALRVGVRYRWLRRPPGGNSGVRPIDVAAGERRVFVARNSPLRPARLTIKEVARARPLHYPAIGD